MKNSPICVESKIHDDIAVHWNNEGYLLTAVYEDNDPKYVTGFSDICHVSLRMESLSAQEPDKVRPILTVTDLARNPDRIELLHKAIVQEVWNVFQTQNICRMAIRFGEGEINGIANLSQYENRVQIALVPSALTNQPKASEVLSQAETSRSTAKTAPLPEPEEETQSTGRDGRTRDSADRDFAQP